MTTDLSRTPSLDALTSRERAFVTNPNVLADPVLAAIQSGFTPTYAKRRANALRRELHYYIIAGELAQTARRDIDAKTVLAELSNLAFSDVLDFFEAVDDIDEATGLSNGTIMVPKQNLKALPAHLRRLIKRIKFDRIVLGDGKREMFYVSDIELHGKDWALKDMIEIMRLKQSGAPKDETSQLLEKMSANELEEIEQVFSKARARLRRTIDKKRDDDAIDV
jgi:hypothetical protein